MADEITNALADIVAWIIAVKCNCAPPAEAITEILRVAEQGLRHG